MLAKEQRVFKKRVSTEPPLSWIHRNTLSVGVGAAANRKGGCHCYVSRTRASRAFKIARSERGQRGSGKGTRELNKITIRNGRPRICVIWMPQIGVAWITSQGWSIRVKYNDRSLDQWSSSDSSMSDLDISFKIMFVSAVRLLNSSFIIIYRINSLILSTIWKKLPVNKVPVKLNVKISFY